MAIYSGGRFRSEPRAESRAEPHFDSHSEFQPESCSDASSANPVKTALILINLGTPDTPTPPGVRRFLKEFLSDPRVVELPRALWWLILHGVILPFRPKKTADKYAAIWMPEGSPLKVHTERQSEALSLALAASGYPLDGLVVTHAFRYGEPSIATTLSRLQAEGITRLLLLPLYPQYSSSTTATAFDAVFSWAQTRRNQPEIRTIRSFADAPGYIDALANSVREHWRQAPRPAASYRLLMSFHGVPQITQEWGDPYHDECQTTARLLAEALQLAEDDYLVCFQSRFGRAKWLQPYTAASLTALAQLGVQRVDILCPGFPADCLETLEEIALEGKAAFLQAGGHEYRYIPCLNERADWIDGLARLVEPHLRGWVD